MAKELFAIALATFVSTPLSASEFFEGREPREVLESTQSLDDTEQCIIAAGVSAYPVRLRGGKTTIFFLTLQTLSGRNLPVWRLEKTEAGSRLTIFDGRRYFKKARPCF